MGPKAILANYSFGVMHSEYIRQYLERVVDSESGVPRSERDMLAFWINLEVPGPLFEVRVPYCKNNPRPTASRYSYVFHRAEFAVAAAISGVTE